MNFNRTHITLAVTGAIGLIVTSAHAQTTAAPERVTVTGSNIKRAAKEGSSPIETISAAEIKASGAKTVVELMKMVPAVGADGFNDNSAQNGFSRGVATASLRNLTSSSTLVLLNGRRIAPSAWANPNNGSSTIYDLNSIPVSAIERVEIFKDGASAVYGSDAVAGVVNFITKTDYNGLDVSIRASANDDGEFARRGATLSTGFGNMGSDGYNVLFSADFSQRDATSLRDGSADIQADQYRAINLRLNPFSSSLSNQPLFYRNYLGTTAAPVFLPSSGVYPAANLVIQTAGCPANRLISAPFDTGVAATLGITSGSSLRDRTFCNYDLNNDYDVQTKGEDASFISRGTFRINADTSAFGELGYSRSVRNFRSAPITLDALSGPVTNFLLGATGAPYYPVLPIGHPDNPFPDKEAGVRYRFENHPQNNDVTSKQSRVLGGIKGIAGTWDWETAVLWNRSERTDVATGYLALPVIRQLLTGRTLASIAADPALSPTLTNQGTSEILMWDAKVSTEFGSLPGGPIGFATGVEYRKEKLDIVPDAITARGDVFGLSNTVVHGQRDVKSAFFEFRTPFLKNFEMDFAGRVDAYEGIKTNFVPKVGAKWTVTDSLALRSAYSEGFIAPTLSQIRPGGVQYFVTSFDPIRCQEDGITPVAGATIADCPKSMAGQGDGNPNLKPEKSKTYSLGMIYSPLSNVDLLIDAYKISKTNEVALVSSDDVINNPNKYPPGSVSRGPNNLTDGNGVPIPNTGSLIYVKTPWINQGSTSTSGIDLEVKVRNSLGELGRLTSSLRANYVLSYRHAELPGYPTHNVVGTNGGYADWANTLGSIPRVKLRLASSLESGAHKFNGAVNYVSSLSHIRRYDGSTTPPEEYSGQTCHWGGTNFDGITGRSSLGVADATTAGLNNGRQTYVAYHPDCTVPAWTTYDLGYFYSGVKDLEVGLTIQNILDTKAPYNPSNTASTIREGYNPGLHNNTGRYFTLTANYKFK